MIRLPNPPDDYDYRWANQYTRELESVIGQLQNLIVQLQQSELPQYTTAERDSLTVKVGTVVFDTTLDAPVVYTDGSGWREIALV